MSWVVDCDQWHNETVRTLALVNQKGGVAKTTSVASIGAALVELGQRVLLIDLDPQGSLTFSLGIDPEDLDESVAEVLLAKVNAADVLLETAEGMHLLPSSIALSQAEEALVSRTGREQRVKVALESVAGDYDWAIIDCPPTLGVLTVSALVAADAVIIPLQAETLSHRGVGQLLDTIHDVRTYLNADLRIHGVLATMYDGRTKHARAVVNAVQDAYELPLLDPPIPKSIRFAEAPAVGQSIISLATRHKGAEAYRQIARGILAADW